MTVPDQVKQVPKWMWASLVGVGTVVAAIGGLISVWGAIDKEMQSSIKTATIQITEEIQTQTNTIAEFYEDDLYERIVILEEEINDLRENGESVPAPKRILLKSMQERLEEFKQR